MKLEAGCPLCYVHHKEIRRLEAKVRRLEKELSFRALTELLYDRPEVK